MDSAAIAAGDAGRRLFWMRTRTPERIYNLTGEFYEQISR
jgi:hypothetical protein